MLRFGSMPPTDFLHRDVQAFGKRAFRLGLSASFGLDDSGVRAAIDRGMNYFFFNRAVWGRMGPGLRDAMKRDREKIIVASGPSIGFFGGSVRRGLEKVLKTLGTDYLDVYQLFWLGVGSAWNDATVAELVKLREEGKVRAIGVSIHDRARAGRLAEDSPLDLFMIRYNAAHPGAERDIFPHLEKRHPAVIAYTATSWRRLLKRPRGWDGPVMTAGDCYRYVLSDPHVDVALCGPSGVAQLDENLRALERGPLSDEERSWMTRFGHAVHG